MRRPVASHSGGNHQEVWQSGRHGRGSALARQALGRGMQAHARGELIATQALWWQGGASFRNAGHAHRAHGDLALGHAQSLQRQLSPQALLSV